MSTEKSSLAASKELMQNYLSELLTEDVVDNDYAADSSLVNEEKQKLDKLLQQASVASQIEDSQLDLVTSAKSENKAFVEPQIDKPTIVTPQVTRTKVVKPVVEAVQEKEIGKVSRKALSDKEYRKGAFQAMFFDVAGLTVAVPLVELGGIHNVVQTTSLMGKPDWFKGVMLHRDEKINVVDTARWIMPEKCSEELLNSLNYQYVIMLNNSAWGLMAENLIDTVTLEQEDVKWHLGSTKRPWLAGLIKERMCALVEVDELISMLDEGANIHLN